jgi:hypothetical protein
LNVLERHAASQAAHDYCHWHARALDGGIAVTNGRVNNNPIKSSHGESDDRDLPGFVEFGSPQGQIRLSRTGSLSLAVTSNIRCDVPEQTSTQDDVSRRNIRQTTLKIARQIIGLRSIKWRPSNQVIGGSPTRPSAELIDRRANPLRGERRSRE